MAEKHWETKQDLVNFFKESDFVFTEFGDYETNVGCMVDAVQYMWRDWYIEEMWPAFCDDCAYIMADYYDDIVKDVIVFDTEIHWNYMQSPEEIADYMWILNECYLNVKEKYESMYTVSQCFKKIFSLFKKQQDEWNN